jgi:hypothetical protein
VSRPAKPQPGRENVWAHLRGQIAPARPRLPRIQSCFLHGNHNADILKLGKWACIWALRGGPMVHGREEGLGPIVDEGSHGAVGDARLEPTWRPQARPPLAQAPATGSGLVRQYPKPDARSDGRRVRGGRERLRVICGCHLFSSASAGVQTEAALARFDEAVRRCGGASVESLASGRVSKEMAMPLASAVGFEPTSPIHLPNLRGKAHLR